MQWAAAASRTPPALVVDGVCPTSPRNGEYTCVVRDALGPFGPRLWSRRDVKTGCCGPQTYNTSKKSSTSPVNARAIPNEMRPAGLFWIPRSVFLADSLPYLVLYSTLTFRRSFRKREEVKESWSFSRSELPNKAHPQSKKRVRATSDSGCVSCLFF